MMLTLARDTAVARLLDDHDWQATLRPPTGPCCTPCPAVDLRVSRGNYSNPVAEPSTSRG